MARAGSVLLADRPRRRLCLHPCRGGGVVRLGSGPVRARVGATEWETSLLRRNGGYVLPVKNAVRRAEGVVDGNTVMVGMSVAPRDGRQANGTGPIC